MKYIIIICSLIFLTLYSLSALPAHADERSVSENQAKAAFVFNAVHYVTWPSTTRGNLVVIGVLGKGSLESEWLNITRKTIGGKKLTVFKSNNIDDMIDCQIVIIEESSPSRLSRIMPLLRDYPILSVGDSSAFLQAGGILNISVINNRISFSVNLSQARTAGLVISSNLLKLATEVIK
jgi:hypothetical protein